MARDLCGAARSSGDATPGLCLSLLPSYNPCVVRFNRGLHLQNAKLTIS